MKYKNLATLIGAAVAMLLLVFIYLIGKMEDAKKAERAFLFQCWSKQEAHQPLTQDEWYKLYRSGLLNKCAKKDCAAVERH